MQSQIVAAIRSMRKMEINYKGEGNRLVCPHALYVSSKGNILVDTYQLGGYSSHSEDVPGWRPFNLDKISSLAILAESFDIAPGYNSLSDRYINSIAKI